MRVAVTSSDGRFIDLHFGKTERFLIYDLESGEPRPAGDAQAAAYCEWPALLAEGSEQTFEAVIDRIRECADTPPAHGVMPDRLAAIAEALSGCGIIVTAMIGDAPREEMERRGFVVYTLTGPVEHSLRELAKLF